MSEQTPPARPRADARRAPEPSWLQTAAGVTWRAGVLVVAGLAVLWLLGRLALVTVPLIVAVILSTLCAPAAQWLTDRGLRRSLAAIVVVFGGVAALGGIFAALTPAFVEQVQALGPTLSEATQQVLTWLEQGPLGLNRAELGDLIGSAGQQAQSSGEQIVSGVVSGARIVVTFLASLALLVVLLFFLVKDGPQIVDWLVTRTPARHRDLVRATGRRAWMALGGYVRGTATIALIDATGIGIGLLILGVPLVLPLALLVFLGAFIPVVGAFIAGLVAVLVALASGGFTSALLVLALVVGVQQVEGNVLQPVVMRRSVALHPVVVLVALGTGATLAGILGAFLSVPVAAVVAAVGNELRLRSEDAVPEAAT